MKRMSNLNDLFAHELRDLYSAEHMILDALPKMAAATENAELKRAFQQHEQTTHEQVRRLETIGDELSIQLKGHKCRGMEGILEECQELIDANVDPDTRDAALIGSAQRVEHYEIAAYGTARTYARHLGHGRAAELLQTTLDEEGETDHRLTRLAEGMINPEAR